MVINVTLFLVVKVANVTKQKSLISQAGRLFSLLFPCLTVPEIVQYCWISAALGVSFCSKLAEYLRAREKPRAHGKTRKTRAARLQKKEPEFLRFFQALKLLVNISISQSQVLAVIFAVISKTQ